MEWNIVNSETTHQALLNYSETFDKPDSSPTNDTERDQLYLDCPLRLLPTLHTFCTNNPYFFQIYVPPLYVQDTEGWSIFSRCLYTLIDSSGTKHFIPLILQGLIRESAIVSDESNHP